MEHFRGHGIYREQKQGERETAAAYASCSVVSRKRMCVNEKLSINTASRMRLTFIYASLHKITDWLTDKTKTGWKASRT